MKNGNLFFSDLKETIINRFNVGILVVLVVGFLLGLLINSISTGFNSKSDATLKEIPRENKIDLHFNVTTYSSTKKQ